MDGRRAEQKAHVHFRQIIKLAMQNQVSVQLALIGVVRVVFRVQFKIQCRLCRRLVGDHLVDRATQPIRSIATVVRQKATIEIHCGRVEYIRRYCGLTHIDRKI